MLNKKGQSNSNTSVTPTQETLPTSQIRKQVISYQRTERERRSAETFQLTNKVPFIRLSGQWLEKAGFQISSKINITVNKNQLIIELDE